MIDLSTISAGQIANEAADLSERLAPVFTNGLAMATQSLQNKVNANGTSGAASVNVAFTDYDGAGSDATTGTATVGTNETYNQRIPMSIGLRPIDFQDYFGFQTPALQDSDTSAFILYASAYALHLATERAMAVAEGVKNFAIAETNTPSVENLHTETAAANRIITHERILLARGERGDKAYDFRHVLLNSVAFNKISADNQQVIRAATGNAPSSGRAFSIGDVWYYDAGSNLASSTVGSVADVFPVVILRQQAMPFSIINGGNFIPLETQREALSGMGKTTTVLRSACAVGIYGVDYTASTTGTNLASTLTQIKGAANYGAITNIGADDRAFMILRGTIK